MKSIYSVNAVTIQLLSISTFHESACLSYSNKIIQIYKQNTFHFHRIDIPLIFYIFFFLSARSKRGH